MIGMDTDGAAVGGGKGMMGIDSVGGDEGNFVGCAVSGDSVGSGKMGMITVGTAVGRKDGVFVGGAVGCEVSRDSVGALVGSGNGISGIDLVGAAVDLDPLLLLGVEVGSFVDKGSGAREGISKGVMIVGLFVGLEVFFPFFFGVREGLAVGLPVLTYQKKRE
jgi:hypothetical protein